MTKMDVALIQHHLSLSWDSRYRIDKRKNVELPDYLEEIDDKLHSLHVRRMAASGNE